MELHVVFFISCWLQAASKVYWIVSNKPVMYGDNIILTCKTEHVLTDRVECPVRQWYGGHKDKLLLFNKASRDVTKYEDRTNLSSTEFSLVIKNYTESDLNINYTCSCGVKSYTGRLGLSDNNFIVHPLRMETHIQQSNEKLSIYIHIERVFPGPKLSIAIGERTLFDNLIFTSVKSDAFYYGTYEAIFNIVADDCGKKPTLFCSVGNEYNIVTISGEPIRNCTVRGDGVSTPRYTNTSTEACTTDSLKNTWAVALSVVVLVCLLTGGVIIYKRKGIQKRIITKITKTDDTIDSDVDQKHTMLDMELKINKENDNGVIVDENYYLVT